MNQGITKDQHGQEQPKDKKRAQQVHKTLRPVRTARNI
jgi:hypothetical protein